MPARRAALSALWLAAVALLTGAPGALSAQQASSVLLREEARLTLPGPAAAVAINADESILAAATAEGRGRWRVHLFDRPSRGKLGVIVARTGAAPRLRFSPVADLLLVAGTDALQLWELPIAPMDPAQPLPEQHLRWEVKPATPPAQARFGAPPDQVYWSQGTALYRRSVQTGVAFTDAPFWQPGENAPPLRDFAFEPQAALVALVYGQRKELGLLDLNRLTVTRDLQGHRFAVLAARFAPGRPLLTLDAGNNLVQWQGNAEPVATTFLDQVPKGFQAVTFTELGEHHLLLIAQDGRGLVIDGRTARPAAELRADGPQRIAVSPTGRYVLAAGGPTLRLYGFAQPASPLDYVRRLRRMDAFTIAQGYVRLMDDSTLSPQLKADLLNEAGRQPPGQELQQAIERLRQAGQEGESERVRYWAEQVLSLQPGQPDAVAALQHLREQRDAQTLAQAQEAYELGQNRVAISLLSSQIEDNSRYYPEALELIRQAEARRSVETVLIQAREKLNLSDYVAAEALVQQALRKEPVNQAALALQDEIDDRAGSGGRQIAAASIGLLLALCIVGFVALRLRHRGGLGAGRQRVRAQPKRKPVGPFVRPTAKAAPHSAAEARRPEPEPLPRRPTPGLSARRAVVEALIKETEERLQTLRQADVYGQHTARLMELDAELSAIQRRVADPSAELGQLHSRLRSIHARVRRLRVDPPHAAPQTEPPRGDPRRGGAPGAEQPRQAKHQSAGAAGPGPARAGQERQQAQRQSPRPEPSPGAAAKLERGTHYEVLQVGPTATPDEIKAAYHKLLKQYHPDLHTASQFDWVRAESERMSRRIALAYQVLSSKGSRARYDRELRDDKQVSR